MKLKITITYYYHFLMSRKIVGSKYIHPNQYNSIKLIQEQFEHKIYLQKSSDYMLKKYFSKCVHIYWN